MQKVLRVAWCYLAPHIFRAHATQNSETLLLETSSISESKDICGWPSMPALPLTVVFHTLEAQHRRPYNMTPSPGRPRGPAHSRFIIFCDSCQASALMSPFRFPHIFTQRTRPDIFSVSVPGRESDLVIGPSSCGRRSQGALSLDDHWVSRRR
ncbi:hypothetical protein BD310DRAFT_435037 [Dichomitus squalens]|uniref:Uncharacterized protein n=1 Tax=Dichomitus squalens TaxID=114155 RepID=A0A4Q9PWG3_9APHY|nr:hypothetical protein BD310DRAFT_435037 [Dichomitus squalens]